jgi:sterol desaturase/sphingolipid hydroxylase (fatty acid hydroxylase superfamily)
MTSGAQTGKARQKIGEAKLSSTKLKEFSSYAALPLFLVFLGCATWLMTGTSIAKTFPYYHSFLLAVGLITFERVFAYRKAVNQRHLIWRDLMSTSVQAFIAGSVMGLVVVPVLHYFPNTFLGRRFLFALSNQLGPLWFQVVVVFLLHSFLGYAVHRYQHYNAFLWKLHSYHHGLTHIQMSNDLVSNPFDWVLRNTLPSLLLSIVGFNPVAVVISGALSVYGTFSHCGADVKGGFLNYVVNTPEVHRWHHAAEFLEPDKFRYGCNFGVSVSFWDVLFGTFCLPKDEKGAVIPPVRLGHPEGYPDEPNYLKILLAPRAFPVLERFFDKAGRKTGQDGLSTVPAE